MTVFKRAEEVGLAIGEALAGITIANGAETDIGTAVHYGRTHIEDHEIPCVSIMEGNDAVEHNARAPQVKVSQRYGLVAYVRIAEGQTPNSAAHAAIRDMKRSIFAGDGTFGRRAISTRYIGRNIGPRADGADIVLALIEIDVTYAENLVEP